jgi:hypothetical protein
LPDRKEVIFRLYFVDTPEEERVYADRIAEQAAYFGISSNAAAEVGHEASEFTKQALAKPFTIQTRWRLALGPEHSAAILCNCADGGQTRLERAACERGTCANLRHANTAAGWSRFADIFGASPRARNASESGAAWRVEQGAAMRIGPFQPLGFSAAHLFLRKVRCENGTNQFQFWNNEKQLP